MKNKSNILSVGVLIIILCVQISGCSVAETNGSTSLPSTQSTANNQKESSSSSTQSAASEAPASNTVSISNEDFDVYYKGITLNEKTSLEDLFAKLNISIGEGIEDNKTINTRAAGMNNDMAYYWYQVSYPDKEHEEIKFDYLYNATLKSGRIVSIDLKSTPTKRGVAVGDTLEKIKLAYGNDIVSNPDTDTTNYINLTINNDTLSFTYDKSSGKILRIGIDYDSNKAMEEMDITGFGD